MIKNISYSGSKSLGGSKSHGDKAHKKVTLKKGGKDSSEEGSQAKKGPSKKTHIKDSSEKETLPKKASNKQVKEKTIDWTDDIQDYAMDIGKKSIHLKLQVKFSVLFLSVLKLQRLTFV